MQSATQFSAPFEKYLKYEMLTIYVYLTKIKILIECTYLSNDLRCLILNCILTS